MMPMRRVVSSVVGRGCLLWPVCSLGKNLLPFALSHFVLQGQLACYSRYLLTSFFCILVPSDEKDVFIFLFGVSSRRSCKSSFQLSNLKKEKEPFKFECVPLPLQEAWQMKVQKSGCPCIAGYTQSCWPQAQFFSPSQGKPHVSDMPSPFPSPISNS